MVFVIIFNPFLDVPLSYHWGMDLYEACADCLRAHELRICDGSTDVRFELCAKHAHVVNDHFFDSITVGEIRTLLHPLYSPVPTFPVTAAGITVTSKQELAKKVKETDTVDDTAYVPVRRHWHGNRHSYTVKQPVAEPVLPRPRPVVTYVHASSGCVHSDQPDVKIVSKKVVETMDAFARERLANIVALLEAGVDYELGPAFSSGGCDGAFARLKNKNKAESSGMSSKLAQDEDEASVDGASTSASVGTSHSTAPTSTLSDSDELAIERAARFIFGATESEARTLLRAEKKRLEECLATSSLAKGMYFKRCNGAWVNALGDILPPRVGCGLDSKGATGVAGDTIRKNSLVGETAASTLSSKNTLLTLSTVSTPATSDNSLSTVINSPPSISQKVYSDQSTRTKLPRPLIRPDDFNSFPLTGYALLRDDGDYESPHGALNPASNVASSLFFQSEKFKPRPFHYRTAMVDAREELVRLGQVRPNDLAYTSWAYNRMAMTARFLAQDKSMKEGGDEELGRQQEERGDEI